MDAVDKLRLASALATLPHLERQVYLAASVEGLTNAQIAARLRIDAAAIEHLLAAVLVILDDATR